MGKKMNLVEYQTYSNIKLVIGLVATLVTAWAYYYEYGYDAPFPGNYWTLVWCGVVYFFLDTVYVIIDWWILDNVFYQSYVTKGSGPLDGLEHIAIGSNLAHFSDKYKLTITATYVEGRKPKTAASENFVAI
jgi:hypothetical protein